MKYKGEIKIIRLVKGKLWNRRMKVPPHMRNEFGVRMQAKSGNTTFWTSPPVRFVFNPNKKKITIYTRNGSVYINYPFS